MALKKSHLYSSLWQSCDELRGGMDASQYKDYVLTLLFMKYVSDKYTGQPDAVIEVPEGGSFADMVRLKGDKEIGDKINKIIGRLAEANDLKGVIDQADFNDEGKLGAGKEMQDRLSKLVAIFDGLDFRANRAEGDDLLGDAYEYLMRHFATESGKSKGQFYTPAEVSRIMAQVIGLERARKLDQPTVYDPTCGSGSLLIKAAAEAGITNLALYGQEMDVATWALARMNMILHGHPTAELWRGNTLAAPHFKNADDRLKTFDFAVANPPFSANGPTASTRPTTSSAVSNTASHQPRTVTMPSCCTSSSRSRAPVRAPSSCRTACCFAATRRPISAASWSGAGSSRASSACRRTSSTAPASPPASSSSTRSTPPPAAASS